MPPKTFSHKGAQKPLDGLCRFLSFVNGKLKDLEFLIGGDDQKPTRETEVRVDGLPAREVLFVGPSKCSKGLFIDAGDRIYVLGAVGKVCEDLDTATAKRFFETFHRRRHK